MEESAKEVVSPEPAAAVQAPLAEDVVMEDVSKQTPIKSKPKKRKAKIPRDSTAPRQPLSGYIRYLNEQREKLKIENPRLSFTEVTRRLASDWGKLPAEEKQQYLTAADQDKERYIREWSAYKTTDAYKDFKRQQQDLKEAQARARGGSSGAVAGPTPPKKAKSMHAANSENAGLAGDNSAASAVLPTLPTGSSPAVGAAAPLRPRQSSTPSLNILAGGLDGTNQSSETDIPIFTEQFLQHNKLRETELRQLRKANTDYEQQNAILQKHLEEMRLAAERVRAEGSGAKARAAAIGAHLNALTDALVQSLGNVSLPGGPFGATKANIEQYMDALKTLVTENKTHAAVRQAREIVGRMDLPS